MKNTINLDKHNYIELFNFFIAATISQVMTTAQSMFAPTTKTQKTNYPDATGAKISTQAAVNESDPKQSK